MPSHHIAVDIGAGSGRAFVGWLDDGKIHTREIHRFSTSDMLLHDKRVLNSFRFYEEVVRALAIYAKEYGPELRSIGADSFSSDFTILDGWGRPIYPIRSYRDDTLVSVEPFIEERYGSYRLYQRNGNHSMPNDTLQQMIRLRREDDPALDNPHGILFVADLMNFLLGGRLANEHSMVSYSRLWNRNEEAWDAEVMDTFGIPSGITTEVVHAGDMLGTLRDGLVRETKTGAGAEIICACSHDTSSAALSIPDPGDDWAFISSGSWSLVGTETAAPVYAEKAWKHNFSNSTMPLRTNMFKKNVTGMWLMQQCKKAWGKYTDEEMVRMAGDHPDVDLYIDVDRRELYAPADMPRAIADVVEKTCGKTVDPSDCGLLVRICLQSIAMKYRYYIELLGELSGKDLRKIYIIGGGSKIRLLNEMTASITNLPVRTGVYEGSVTGNLLLQMYGSGELASKEKMRGVVMNTFPVDEFLPENHGEWNRKYERYREMVGF